MSRLDGTTFRRQMERALIAVGFERAGGRALVCRGSSVAILLAPQAGFPRQWWVNVGFWLDDYRIERLAPELRETIVAAGCLDDAEHAHAFERLLDLVKGPIDDRLRALGTEEGLRRAFLDGELSNGMITWQAREWLERATGHDEARHDPT